VVQIQIDPVRSIEKSPMTNVPVEGAPEAVAPTYREAAVAPVRPEAMTAVPVNVPATDEALVPVRLIVLLPVTAPLKMLELVQVLAVPKR
jgi:hypothetical protein